MECDLHIHSEYSDGSVSVPRIVEIAKRKNLSYIAVSDHDTLEGVNEAVLEGQKLGVSVLPAVETTATDIKTGRSVHILGYSPKNQKMLSDFLKKTLESRKNQKLAMIEKIQKIYPLLAREDVMECAGKSAAIYEPHVIKALCDLGYDNSPMGSLLDELISKKGSCYVPSHYPKADDVLEVMREAGATIVIAHPEQFNSFQLVVDLAKDKRIDGVEVSHPRNSSASQVYLQAIVDKYDLIATGGSDFHGGFSKKPHPIGSYGCKKEIAERILGR
ncbi:MAG: PHP domain-containing protein [Hespellia sp.]|nr:PHP domain-containing protein [Hespellia sp.]